MRISRMRSPYRGEQPIAIWREAWRLNVCENLPKSATKNTGDPMKNRDAITVIVTHALEREPDASYADLKDIVKGECARLSLAYNVEVIAAALDAATRQRKML